MYKRPALQLTIALEVLDSQNMYTYSYLMCLGECRQLINLVNMSIDKAYCVQFKHQGLDHSNHMMRHKTCSFMRFIGI